MAIITLTTDLGHKDYYAAAIKGAILSSCPSAAIVDISHKIPPFAIQTAAFNLKNAYEEFPDGTIHIIGVDPAATSEHQHAIAFHKGHYFIAANNGVFSLLFDENPQQLLALNADRNPNSTFPVKDIFAKVAAELANGTDLGDLTSQSIELVEKHNLAPTIESDSIRGMIIYLDSMGNITTNISERQFHFVGKGRNFEIQFRRSGYTIRSIMENYHEVPDGELLALFNTSGNLEIAINKGNAGKLLGMKLSDVIRIDFR